MFRQVIRQVIHQVIHQVIGQKIDQVIRRDRVRANAALNASALLKRRDLAFAASVSRKLTPHPREPKA
jgi:hypothetical protein